MELRRIKTMSKNTRQQILVAAKKLFNERGYNDVSTRDISDSIGISKGNLTYYFKKKEDIVEALLKEKPGKHQILKPVTLDELNDFFIDIQKTIRENAYYFWHHTQIAQLSKSIKKMQDSAFNENVDSLTNAFDALFDEGMIRKEEYSNEYDNIIDSLIISSIYWIPYSKLRGTGIGKSNDEFPRHAWNVMYPLLTKKGKTAARAFLP